MSEQTAIIIGAGPAGLTAALELLRRTGIKPLVLEESGDIGGISRTVVHNGNRMDIGGHRFLSKSDWVMRWWQEILPVEQEDDGDGSARQGIKRMLVRSRLSRIYFLRKFFSYPIRLDLATIRNLGCLRLARIAASYVASSLFPRRPERNLEDFIVNRFGRELYVTFFKDYTEKVWGVPCSAISPEWGAQRIKGLSVGKAFLHAARKLLTPAGSRGIGQKGVQTSLIERFLYPCLGPGQMWQEVAKRVTDAGGRIVFHHRVTAVSIEDGRATAVAGINQRTGEPFSLPCDFLFSTMPVRDLIGGMTPPPPPEVARVAAGLQYRDFLTIGLLLPRMKPHPSARTGAGNNLLPDNWIYIQERDVSLGRLQIFNNWSPYLVKDPATVWLGLEYFCREGDELWRTADEDLIRFGAGELAKIGLIDDNEVLDGVVARMPKAYPAYFGTHGEFQVIIDYLEGLENLFLIGRNGMHRYNNQDHSMLTARLAVDNILGKVRSKGNIWAVNIDDEYHEEKT